MKKICLTVTTDLTYDQRMIRICTSLAGAGYQVWLIGRQKKSSRPLAVQPYRQKRLFTFFEKSKLFYAEYNLRLFFYLLFKQADAICAIDLDTIVPVWLVSGLRKTPRVYDAHELFCEMKEIVTRPSVYRAWKKIEQICVPRFRHGYTVNQPIADEFRQMYGVRYNVIRNIPLLQPPDNNTKKEAFILYQGAVNEGRSFETLIPAMQWVNLPLVICGDGNFMGPVQELIKTHQLTGKVILKGLVPPEELRRYTQRALIGITLFENNGRSNYLSLANRFFDYIHAGTPQLCVSYPVYQEINNLYETAVLIQDLSPESIAAHINKLVNDPVLYSRLADNCRTASKWLNWQQETEKLLDFYKKIFS